MGKMHLLIYCAPSSLEEVVRRFIADDKVWENALTHAKSRDFFLSE